MDPAPGERPDPLRRPGRSLEPDPGVSSKRHQALDRDLAAFESSRQKSVSSGWGGAADAYRLLGQILGGVFGGVGLGWLVDHFLHTTPWGLVIGIAVGSGISIFAAIRTASRAGARSEKKLGPASPVPDDDED